MKNIITIQPLRIVLHFLNVSKTLADNEINLPHESYA